MRANFAANGSKVISESHRLIGGTEVSNWEFEYKDLRTRARVAIVNGKMYSLIGAPVKPGDNDDVIEHFLESFSVDQKKGPR